MGFMFKSMPEYQPQTIGPTGDNYGGTVDTNTAYANRPASDFQNDINQNVKEQSSLLGPKDPSNPEGEAMNARAKQVYESQVNSMMKNVQNQAVARQNQLQSRSIDQQAAIYTNLQSRANLNWEQLAYQREAAIFQETTRRKLIAGLFAGAGSLLGGAAGAGMYWARQSGSAEQSLPQVPGNSGTGTSASDYRSMPSYSSAGSRGSDYQNLPNTPGGYTGTGQSMGDYQSLG